MSNTDFSDAYQAGQSVERILSVDGRAFVILAGSEGSERVHSLEELLGTPDRKKGHVRLGEEESFVTYVRQHKGIGTAIFADPEKVTLVAVLDGHEPLQGDAKVKAGWGQHRATLQLKTSIEWQAWTAIHRRKLTQVQLVDFLEDHLIEVMKPDGADLLELCRDLKGMKKAEFRSGKNLSNGTIQLQYVEELEASSTRKGDVVVPEFLTLALPVYFNEAPREMRARLRWGIDEGKVSFTIVIERLEQTTADAFREVVTRVKGSAAVLTYYGVPA